MTETLPAKPVEGVVETSSMAFALGDAEPVLNRPRP